MIIGSAGYWLVTGGCAAILKGCGGGGLYSKPFQFTFMWTPFCKSSFTMEKICVWIVQTINKWEKARFGDQSLT